MKNYRYGKFRFDDYNTSWFSIVCLLSFSIASAILDLSPLFIVFPALYAVFWLCAIFVPQFEYFVLLDDSITVVRGRKKRTISLPAELTLVISYADICPPLAMRTTIGNKTHILKNKYAISIIHNSPLDITLADLHQNMTQIYTTSRIQMVFDDYRYIYSFVCEQILLDKLLANRKCLLIIPESLLNAIELDLEKENVYIDKDY